MTALFVLLSLLISGVPFAMYLGAGRAVKVAGIRLQDPLAWLIAKNLRKARALAAAGAVAGIAILVAAGTWLVQVPWALDQQSPVAIGYGGRCTPSGARYAIVVNDTTYLCGGGDAKCPRGEVKVAYHDRNPNRCRVRNNVDRPSLYELRAILLGLVWLAFAGVVTQWQGVVGHAYDRQSRGYLVFAMLLFGLLAALLLSPLLYNAWSAA